MLYLPKTSGSRLLRTVKVTSRLLFNNERNKKSKPNPFSSSPPTSSIQTAFSGGQPKIYSSPFFKCILPKSKPALHVIILIA